jgi:uncharacterized radical SAM superfamily Fe-S cluster-containing enzyme
MRVTHLTPGTFEEETTEIETQETLPLNTQSLCPECLAVIDATIYEDQGQVLMRKTCPSHGLYRELLSTDATFFKLMIHRDRAIPRGVTRPMDSGTRTCPQGCGICAHHLSSPVMMNIDLTNRCNLDCPVCFANAGARQEVLELDLDQVRRLLDMACAVHDVQPPCLQYTGGEPTIHPQFLEALREAKKRGFVQVQIATNGIAFARNPEFAAQASEAGLNVAYLQFDGLSDQVYRQTRGRPLLELKLAAIENLYAADIRTILVPTIAKGINEHQIGPIARFAVEHVDKIVGISWQPIAFTGRLDYDQRLARRFTIADLAREIETQTGYAQMYRDWYPFCFVDPFTRFLEAVQNQPNVAMSCHPVCGAGTYLIVDPKTHRTWPIPAFVDVENLMQTLASATAQFNRRGLLKKLRLTRELRRLRKFYYKDAGPSDWSFEDFADFMLDFADFRQRYPNNKARVEAQSKYRYSSLLMATMHFQDVYNYQLDRVQRCVIHYAGPDGRIYPFCSYNSGPCHRSRVERQFAIPLREYQDTRCAGIAMASKSQSSEAIR